MDQRFVKNVFLIGYRGSGKTSVAQLLSQKTGMPYYSMDKIIEEQENQTISEIVAQKGWEYFRKKESELLAQLIEKEGIIDCGGGIIEKDKNRKMLKKAELTVFLWAKEEIIKQRLLDKKDRPSLTGADFIEEIHEVYTRRLPLYEKTAHYIVDANDSIEETAEAILFLMVKSLL